MKKIIFLIITCKILLSDIYDTYRFKGIKPIINKLEKDLQNKAFWIERLKNKNVKYGYFETPTFILFCNKLTKTLQVNLYKNGKLKNLITFNNIIVGKLGDKQKEGDLKTPIGNYTLIDKIVPKNTFYGPLAFVTSYPNLFDRINKKNGYGIWIHGKPLDGERGDISKGCIVLENKDILYLNKIIDYKNTILETTQHPFYANKKEIASILALIYQWRYAWKNSDLKTYLSFYSKNFKRADKMNFEDFKKYKAKIFNIRKNQKIEIYFDKIKILPYQTIRNDKIYEIIMYEKYLSPTYTFKGQKIIFVKKEGDKFKIILEK